MTDPWEIALVLGAAFAAGIINAIAGGGSLLSYPTLVAVGLSPVTANLTNTVALCPGYFGATLAQRRELLGQGRRMWIVLPAGALGGAVGAYLLLTTDDRAFEAIVPWLLLAAAGLVAVQQHVRTWLAARPAQGRGVYWAALCVGVAGVYGGYFGAGLGVIVLAALALVLADSLTRVSALKQTVSLVVNVAASVVFFGSGRLDGRVVAVMVIGALAGGMLGGAIASRVSAVVLRWVIVVFATAVAIWYLWRGGAA